MQGFQWVPWALSACALGYTVLKDMLSKSSSAEAKRRELDALVEKRLQALEVGRQLDRGEIMGELRIINVKMGQAQGQVSQVKTLLNDILQ